MSQISIYDRFCTIEDYREILMEAIDKYSDWKNLFHFQYLKAIKRKKLSTAS